METTGERLEYYKRQKGLSYIDYGTSLGISSDAIRVAIKANKVRDIYINKLSENFGISKEWILNGTGEMEGFKKENSQQNEESFLQKHYDKLLLQKDQFLDSVLKDNERLRKELDLMRSNNNKN